MNINNIIEEEEEEEISKSIYGISTFKSFTSDLIGYFQGTYLTISSSSQIPRLKQL